MNIRFGLPKREIVSKERYPETPVLTMEKVEGQGFNRRFTLNKKAVDLLQLIPGISSVIFAFDEDAYISKYESEDSVLLGKNMAFSNKKYYEHIAKMYNLDQSQDSDFELTDAITVGDAIVYRMQYITPEVVFTPHTSPIIDKEIEHLVEVEGVSYEDLCKAEELYMEDTLEEDENVDEETGEIVGRKKEQFLMNAY